MPNPYRINPYTLRKVVLNMVYDKKSGHIGSSFSLADFIASMFTFRRQYILSGDDKVILSKGHAVPILYAAYNQIGLINDEELKTFREINSRLEGHPVSSKLPILNATTGSLGQGLSVAIGMALAKQKRNEYGTVSCILGDGEMQEGQIWEALLFLANNERIKNLDIYVDCNNCQNDGKLSSDTMLMSMAIYKLFQSRDYPKPYFMNAKEPIRWGTIRPVGPNIIFLRTEKGQGLPDKFVGEKSHSFIPNEEQYNKIMSHLTIKESEFNNLYGIK